MIAGMCGDLREKKRCRVKQIKTERSQGRIFFLVGNFLTYHVFHLNICRPDLTTRINYKKDNKKKKQETQQYLYEEN